MNRRLLLLISLLIMMLLYACGPSGARIPALELDSITPARGSNVGGTLVTLTGEGFYETTPGSLTVKVCGSPVQNLQLVDAVQRTVVLPGGGSTSIRVATTLTGTTAAMSNTTGDVTVTRPDGQQVTLEGAYDCFDPAPAVSLETSTITTSSESITADGTSTLNVTVQLKNDAGVNLTTSAGVVALSTTGGSLSDVVDHEDGSYTAVLTSSTVAGDITLSGSLDGEALSNTATVTFTAGAPTGYELGSANGGITEVGGSRILEVRITDVHDNAVADVAVNWSVISGSGSLSAVTPNTSTLGISSTEVEPAANTALSSTSNAQGIARVEWTLGPTPGEQHAQAEIPVLDNLILPFTATGVPAAASQLVIISSS